MSAVIASGVRRIEPVVRVAVGVDVRAALGAQPRRLRLDEAHVLRRVEDRHRLRQLEPREPRLVIEADADEQRGGAHARELRGLHFDRMRILLGRGEALDFDARAADRLDERLQVRRGRDDAQLLLCEDPSRRRRADSASDDQPKAASPRRGGAGCGRGATTSVW